MRGGSSTERPAAPNLGCGGAGEEDGFVLVSVLWLLALLAAVAATFVTVTRLHVQASTNASRNARAELLADGAVRLLAFRLATAAAESPSDAALPPTNGIPFRCLLPGGAAVTAAIQDQGGLADLNAAPVALIEWALVSAGIAAGSARRLAASVADFRDTDDDASPDGAEKADYAAASLLPGPKNAPFQAVAELDQVLGFDAATLSAARASFTVHSRSDGIDPRAAPRPPATAVPSTAPAVVPDGDRAAAGVPDAFVRPSRRRHFGIVAAATTDDAGRFLRRAVIEILRQPDQPFRILEWQQALQADEALGEAEKRTDALRPCAG